MNVDAGLGLSGRLKVRHIPGPNHRPSLLTRIVTLLRGLMP